MRTQPPRSRSSKQQQNPSATSAAAAAAVWKRQSGGKVRAGGRSGLRGWVGLWRSKHGRLPDPWPLAFFGADGAFEESACRRHRRLANIDAQVMHVPFFEQYCGVQPPRHSAPACAWPPPCRCPQCAAACTGRRAAPPRRPSPPAQISTAEPFCSLTGPASLATRTRGLPTKVLSEGSRVSAMPARPALPALLARLAWSALPTAEPTDVRAPHRPRSNPACAFDSGVHLRSQSSEVRGGGASTGGQLRALRCRPGRRCAAMAVLPGRYLLLGRVLEGFFQASSILPRLLPPLPTASSARANSRTYALSVCFGMRSAAATSRQEHAASCRPPLHLFCPPEI